MCDSQNRERKIKIVAKCLIHRNPILQILLSADRSILSKDVEFVGKLVSPRYPIRPNKTKTNFQKTIGKIKWRIGVLTVKGRDGRSVLSYSNAYWRLGGE